MFHNNYLINNIINNKIHNFTLSSSSLEISKQNDNKLPSCIFDATDPNCLKLVYNINATVSNSKSIQSVANFGESAYYNDKDLQEFWN